GPLSPQVLRTDYRGRRAARRARRDPTRMAGPSGSATVRRTGLRRTHSPRTSPIRVRFRLPPAVGGVHSGLVESRRPARCPSAAVAPPRPVRVQLGEQRLQPGGGGRRVAGVPAAAVAPLAAVGERIGPARRVLLTGLDEVLGGAPGAGAGVRGE